MLAYLSHVMRHQSVGSGKGQGLWIGQMTAALMSYFELLEESKRSKEFPDVEEVL